MNDNGIKQGTEITLERAIGKATQKIQQLTALKFCGVVGAVTEENGNFCIKIEMIERTGIPDTMDLIGLYEVSLDSGGNLLNYSRQRIRKRGEDYNNN